jgi:DNA-binding CsgD family transcriptional regulator
LTARRQTRTIAAKDPRQGEVVTGSEATLLSAIICCIYDAAVDPQLWPEAMRRACEFVGGSSANLFWHDMVQADGDAMYSYNNHPHWAELYSEIYAPLNPVFPAAAFQPVGSVVAATDLVPAAELRETRFYKEWLAPQQMTDALGILLERDATRAAFLSILWRERAIDDEARRRLALLVPHLLRAVAIGRLFIRQQAKEAALTETLDHLEAGVFLISGGGRIVFANTRGQAMLAEGTLVAARNGILHAVAAEADGALADSLRALEDRAAPGAAQRVAIRLSDATEPNWIAHVLPLMDGARRRAGDAFAAVAAVFVRGSSLAERSPLEALAQLYELTAGEIRVVEAILRMSRLDDIAAALGISRATVKTHLNRAYRKCRVTGQSDLIRLISELGPA